MSKIELHSYMEGDCLAKVNKVSGRKIYEVDCYKNDQLDSREIFNTEQSAEDFAEDWVLANGKAGNNDEEQNSSDE